MTRAEWDDLGDDELTARLVARGHGGRARELTEQRDDPYVARVIDDLVGD